MLLLRNRCCPKLAVAAVKGIGFGKAGVGPGEESGGCHRVWVRDGGGVNERVSGDGQETAGSRAGRMAGGMDVRKRTKDYNWACIWSWVNRVSFHKGTIGGGTGRKRRVLC